MKVPDLRIGLDMQKYYDDLVLYWQSIHAQLRELEKSPMICTHTKTEIKNINDLGEFVVCSHCHKVLKTPDGVDWAN